MSSPAGFEGARHSEAVRIWLLGRFRVSVGFRNIAPDVWHLRKAAALVKLLALSPGHRLHREQAMDLLWPDSGRRTAANNLRTTLHAARKVLDPTTGERYLASEDKMLVLCPQGNLWVDVEAFEEAAVNARRVRDPAAYRAAIGLYAGELLPEDRYEEWTESKREVLRRMHAALLIELAALYGERAEHGPAVESLQSALSEEPANEEAHAGLMRTYALFGKQGEALAQYHRLREALSRHLGTEPGATTRALNAEIAAGRFPSTQPTAPPLNDPPQSGKHNLPMARTSFVGREREMAEVKGMLAMTNLLTLTGTGGCGKTRLALEVARELVGTYPDGVWLVDLAPLSEEELVPQAVAEVLGVPERPDRPLTATLAEALRTRKVLLVLDNCEHLVEACARLADVLLDSCPGVRVLATSREPLNVANEIIWSVPPLSVPDVERTLSVEGLSVYDSARLFVERALRRPGALVLTAGVVQAVAEICQELDGIPLAIELAAAKVGILAVGQISERLGDSMKLLTGGNRTATPRHRTLRGTLDWSYDLLTEQEKGLFRRLSTFAGGWTLEAAEGVGAGDGVEEGDVLDLLGRLVDKSLVVAETVETLGATPVRYRFLEPVRQYAREKLDESGESEVVRHRHAEFFLVLAEEAEQELKGWGQLAWLARLEVENDNLRTAMAWLLDSGEIESAVRLAWALLHFWGIHGHQGEGRRWAEEALAKGETLPPHARAKAIHVQAAMSYGLGSPERVRSLCEETALLFREAGDKYGWALAVSGMGLTTLQQGDAEGATTLMKEALELFREEGDKWGMSNLLAHMGTIPLGQGDHALAERYLEEALALSKEIGNVYAAYVAIYTLAQAAQNEGNNERAAQLYKEGLRFALKAGDQANIAYGLEGLAELAEASGEPERAVRLFGAAEALLEDAVEILYVQAQDRSLRDQAVDALHSRMDETTFSAAWAEGGAMNVSEAVEYALSEEKPASPASPADTRQSPTVTGQVALTRREQEVAALVARGLTNRQIATELSISEHTVANHVAKILKKLELGSRSQITAWVLERRMPP